MNKKQKKMLVRILVAFVLLVGLHFVPVEGALRFGCYMVPYLVVGYDILIKAAKGVKNRQMFDECFLMAVATVGAVALALYSGSGDYTEAVAVMLFYQVGELFQSYAVGKSRRNISELMDISPDYANIEQDGKLEQVDPDEVEIGSIIIVQPGEKVPIEPGHQRAHWRKCSAQYLQWRRSYQRLHQYDRRAENQNDQGIWRVHRFQDSRAGGKRQLA